MIHLLILIIQLNLKMINKFKKDKIKKIVQKKVKANKSVKAVNKKLLYNNFLFR